MELTHSFTVPASIDTTWATFMDLREVGECFPGATVTDVSADSFTGQVKVKLGPIAMVYAGTGTFLERDDAAHRAVIEGRGKDKRGNGTAGATATIALSDAGSGSTKVDVTTDLQITGKPAQFGRGVMQDVSDKLLAQFVACIEGKVSGDRPASSSSGAPAPAAAPSSAGSGADVESGVSTGRPAAPREVGTAAMFGATAGSDSWEARRGGSNGSSGGASAGSGGSAGAPAAQRSSVSAAASGSPTAKAAPIAPQGRAGSDDALDLGSTVLPIMLKSYGKEIGIGVLGFVLGWKLGRFLPG
ncbi:SRPBCC family protein [Agilicoccus flavus]|uniref:SRPBCC family protein n=1 Tax=Agilicoccus flavus TaxID=2775968 RepID=UPI001CF71119|nr:SRPBCC family protein [Agilicoccus flavus]